jgi:hypothetical protein
MRTALLAVLLLACGDSKKPTTQTHASGSAPSTPSVTPTKSIDAKAIGARFAELRDDKALGCLVDRQTWIEVTAGIGEVSLPIVVRLAAFASIERAKANGPTPTVRAIEKAILALAEVDDVDGLREAFAMLDATLGVALRDDRVQPYRARIGGKLPQNLRVDEALESVREGAFAKEPNVAARYDKIIGASTSPRANVEALAALRRTDGVRVEIDKAQGVMKLELAEAWLHTDTRLGAPLKDAVEKYVEVATSTKQVAVRPLTVELARRAFRGAEIAPLRAMILAADATQPIVSASLRGFYVDALLRGDVAAKTEVAAKLDAAERTRIDTLYTGPLGDALALAGADLREQSQVWARWVTEGADPAFAKKLADVACTGAKAPPSTSGTPTPAAAAKLVVTSKKRPNQMECERVDVIAKLQRDTEALDEKLLEAQCQGACTPAEKREGAKALAEIQKRIEKGEASESETDYNFTDCISVGHRFERTVRAGERDVAIIAERYLGPHSVERTRYHLALEVCGKIFLGDAFAEVNLGQYKHEDFTLRETNGVIEVSSANEWYTGVVYRLTLPVCPAAPTQQVLPVE